MEAVEQSQSLVDSAQGVFSLAARIPGPMAEMLHLPVVLLRLA